MLFYPRIPKSFKANIDWRRLVYRKADKDAEWQADLKAMCREDLLFFINTFCWIFEPRRALVLPFISWPFQDRFMLDVAEDIEQATLAAMEKTFDSANEKSRDQGFSWMVLMVFLWRCMFYDMQSFLIASRKEELVDQEGNPDTLFAKIDFAMGKLPWWLMPHFDRTKRHLLFTDSGSVIDGSATTGDFGRGGRRLATLADEFASFSAQEQVEVFGSLTAVSRCNIYGSTPKGVGNMFYQITHPEVLPGMKKRTLHWKDHPLQRRGLYRAWADKIEYLDGDYDWDKRKDYPFIRDGAIRSPWYDAECKRYPVASLRAQELDISYIGSGTPFFQPDEVQRLLKETVREPTHVGELDYNIFNGQPRGFVKTDNGRLKLWCSLGPDMRPGKLSHYAIAADISSGTGASNTVFVVGDKVTGEKVAEYVAPNLTPERAAVYFAALGRFFGGEQEEAYAIWDANGPGRAFGSVLTEKKGIAYTRFYLMKNEKKLSKKISDEPGWTATGDAKQALLSNYATAVFTGKFVDRSRDAVLEMHEYQFMPSGDVAHVRTNNMDPSGAKKNHGDRVFANALLTKILTENIVGAREKPKIMVRGSLADRLEQYERSKGEQKKYAGRW